MNKLELIDAVAEKLNLTKRQAMDAVECVFDTIKGRLAADEEVNIGGFGLFKVRKRGARKGLNPRTGEKIDVEPSRAPAFRPSKTLRDLLNEKKD